MTKTGITHMSRRSHVTQPRAHDNSLFFFPSKEPSVPKRPATLHVWSTLPPEREIDIQTNPWRLHLLDEAHTLPSYPEVIQAARSLGWEVVEHP